MPEATITSKGQITIPKAVREHLRVEAGDRLDFIVTADGEVLVRPARRDIHELRGLLQKPRKAVTVEEIDQAIRLHLRERKLGKAGMMFRLLR
jgi:AbrB family looped-hinge helix DNA binding protein